VATTEEEVDNSYNGCQTASRCETESRNTRTIGITRVSESQQTTTASSYSESEFNRDNCRSPTTPGFCKPLFLTQLRRSARGLS
jgi:hypothetical protein